MNDYQKNGYASLPVKPIDGPGYAYYMADHIAPLLETELPEGEGGLVVADENVRWYLDEIISSGYLSRCAYETFLISADRKDLPIATTIWDRMIACKCNRAIAVGGGTICDLTAFTASSFKRGIPVHMFPTTPLAAMDASISGKTGIDYNGQKNSVGTMHYPNRVVATLTPFETLDPSEFISGFSEAVKLAVTSSGDFFHALERWSESWQSTVPGVMEIMFECCRLKADIVGAPPNKRLLSLYGHAIGHGIESFSPPRRRHGDCVAIGLHLEGYLALKRGFWGENEWLRQEALLRSLDLPTTVPESISTSDLIERIAQSKSCENGMLNLILPAGIGRAVQNGESFVTRVGIEEAMSCVEELR
jgi:3-dehydroquinate synthase